MAKLNPPIRILVPVGSLGAGVLEEELRYGIEQGGHAIATDAGSTDSGAAYLALGISKNNRGSVKRDLSLLMRAGHDAGIPVIVGTCGQAGGDANVDWTRDIALEIARELDIQPRIALLYSEQEKGFVKGKLLEGKIDPLPPKGKLDEKSIDDCDHIVAVLGAEPYIAALQAGADLILGGRSTDTAVLASFALMCGVTPGPAWHAAKIAECGAQCTALRNHGSGVLISIENDALDVEPLSPSNHCTPESVSAHMLYENSDPFRLTEPGGVLDVTDAVYKQVTSRSVRVTGSKWETTPYTLKLEGASSGQYQTVMLIGIQDPAVTSNVDQFHDRLLDALYKRVQKTMGAAAGEFHISLRMYGWNAVSGDQPPPDTPAPREIGVLFVATAESQEIASQIAKACNPYFFHFPVEFDKELPSYAFPFSPADIDRGPVFEFRLNHVVRIDDPMEMVRTVWINSPQKERT